MVSDNEQRGQEAQLALVSEELTSEAAAQVQRANAMEQRATILIGAAGVAGALQFTGTPSWATYVNLALTFLAAVAGVVVVFPRRGDVLDIRAIRNAVLQMSATEAQYRLVDTKIEILEQDEQWLTRRGHITRVGFAFLALSILFALIGSATSTTNPEPAPTPTLSAGVDDG